MTPHRPSRWLEWLAGRLVPPASREHVLGDLAESTKSDRAYAAQLGSLLPRVLWTQIRRRATVGFILTNAVFTGIALAIALAALSPSFAGSPRLIRVAIPWAIWIAGCAVSAAYGPLERPERWNGRLFLGTLIVTFAASQVSGVPVSGVAAALAGVVALFLAFALPVLKHGMPPPLSADTLPRHARLFQTFIRWRNARELIAVAVVVSMNVTDLQEARGLELVANVLIMSGALFIGCFMLVRAGSRQVPGDLDMPALLRFHRGEIERQRDVLRAVPYWYLLPFVPGLLVSIAHQTGEMGTGALLGMPAIAAIFAFVWWLNAAAARHLDTQLQQVKCLEES
jgi:hypothetical protein